MSGKLYLVGTPIGNLKDLSPRAAETFSSVDFIAAEDTRVSVKLLNYLDIKKPLVSYYEHNRTSSGEKILERILNGENCALVSDAGMPAISDPGEDLCRICAQAGVEVIVVPGPSAVVSALALSALPTGRFCFEGFLSTAKKSRYEHLESLKNETRTMVFYEAPHKLKATLADMSDYFGADRKISICRELTKIHEETLRFTLGAAVEYYDAVQPKGEFVLVIDGAEPEKAEQVSAEDAVVRVLELREGGLSLKNAVRTVAEDTGISKNLLYDMALRSEKK